MDVAERDDLLEVGLEDAFDATKDWQIRSIAQRASEEVGEASQHACIGVGTDLLQAGRQERHAAAEKDLSISHWGPAAGGGRDHVPLDVGVAHDREGAELRHRRKLLFL